MASPRRLGGRDGGAARSLSQLWVPVICSVGFAPAQSAAIALPNAPGARRLELGGAVAAVFAIYAIPEAMESTEGPGGVQWMHEAETVVDRLAAQSVLQPMPVMR